MIRRRIGPLVLALLAAFPALAANAPARVNYQGVLRDAADRPLTGTYDITFRFFDAATEGDEILVNAFEGTQGVAVSGGLFNVSLGAGRLDDGSGPGNYESLEEVFLDYTDVWLEVEVGSETLLPRTRIAAAPWSMSATRAETAGTAGSATTAGTATNATYASYLGGQPAGYFTDTSANRQVKYGAFRYETNYPWTAALDVIATGSSPMAVWAQNDDGTLCKVGEGVHALECSSNPGSGTWVAYFGNTGSFSNVAFAQGPYGVRAGASFAPGDFQNFSGNIVHVGKQTYKIEGNGAVSFVQNHPEDASRVVVYAAPEGDEVAVYTRGSGRLSDGVARVALGETFAFVANPDLGLTATVTPRGESPVPLSVSSVSTRELVVRGPAGSDVAFDYAVWGLRIGFESHSIVQPKAFEAKIPSMKDHEAFFREDPDLRDYTALARFRKIEGEALGRTEVDLSRTEALRAAVGVFADATPPTWERSSNSAVPAEATRGGVQAGTPVVAADPGIALPSGADPAGTFAAESPVVLHALGSVEAGDVVALDASAPGFVRAAAVAGDPLIVGCALDVRDGVAVAVSRIAMCRVDATHAPVGVGDRLVASPNPGHAMRHDGSLPEATVLGRAIDPLPSGTGTIRVLVTTR